MKHKLKELWHPNITKILALLAVLTGALLIILIFSEEIGLIKQYVNSQNSRITKLENEVSSLNLSNKKSSTSDTPLKVQEYDNKPTYTINSSEIKNIETRIESIYLLKQNLAWTYSFETTKPVGEIDRFIIVENESKLSTYVIVYSSLGVNNASTSLFGLIPYDETEKRIIPSGYSNTDKIYYDNKNIAKKEFSQSSNLVNSVLVIVDDKVVLFNDFASNNLDRKTKVLNMIAKSNDSISPKVKLIAQKEL
jgi:hypothetical protein